MALLTAVTSAIENVITWVGTVVGALINEPAANSVNLHDLLPLFAIGIAISAVLLGVCAEKKECENGRNLYEKIPCQAV